MHHFAYRNGVLHAEAVNLIDLAQSVGTPFYCYSTATLTRHFDAFAEAFSDVKACYAMKANSNQAVIKTLANRGAGADVVSARRAGARAGSRYPARENHVLRQAAVLKRLLLSRLVSIVALGIGQAVLEPQTAVQHSRGRLGV